MSTFDYNDVVRVAEGQHEGRKGVIVGVPTRPDETYTVEFDDGSDANLLERQLVSDKSSGGA